ncbi:hypothetical protein AQ724_07460 [Burkholderia pseudomallei]|nr:hypothetical protein AQ724_07460 [Burkholderia pseudomallei]
MTAHPRQILARYDVDDVIQCEQFSELHWTLIARVVKTREAMRSGASSLGQNVFVATLRDKGAPRVFVALDQETDFMTRGWHRMSGANLKSIARHLWSFLL